MSASDAASMTCTKAVERVKVHAGSATADARVVAGVGVGWGYGVEGILSRQRTGRQQRVESVERVLGIRVRFQKHWHERQDFRVADDGADLAPMRTRRNVRGGCERGHSSRRRLFRFLPTTYPLQRLASGGDDLGMRVH